MVTSRPSSPPLGHEGAEPLVDADLEQLVKLLRSVSDRLDAHIGGLYVLSEDGELLQLLMTLGAARQFTRPWQRVGLAAPIPVADAARERRVVWVGSAEEMARRYPQVAVAMPYAFSLLAAPLVAHGAIQGAVFILWPAAHPPVLTSEEYGAITRLAAELGETLARAADGGRPVRPGLRPLTIAADDGGPETLDRIIARLPEGMCGLGLDGRIAVVTPTAAELLGKPPDRLLGQRPWVVLPWLRDPVYEHHYRSAVISGEPGSFVALRPPDRWLSFQLFPGHSGLTARISAVRATRGDLPHVPDVPEPLPATRPGALYYILHLAGALTEAATVQDVVRMVSDQILPGFGGQAVAVLLAEAGRLRIVGHRGYPPGLVDQFDGTPLTEQTPGVQAATNPVPAFFETRAELERAYPHRRETQDGMAAWAYLPLMTSGRLIGTCVLAFAEPHHFGIEERAVLTALGGLIAQALDRARLYDTKLTLAHGLQDSLLPRALPPVPGLETATRYLPGTDGMDIGGDFYDLIRVNPDTAAIVIGDVQGHNVRAAALMGQIRTAVRAFATADADPSRVLARTNRLLADLDTTLLASCVYLKVDLVSREAWLADAGHPVPLLRGPDGRTRPLQPRSGLVLNVDRAADYPLTHLTLPIGTTLALYTDGLIETPGGDLDQGLAHLGAVLARAGGGPLEELADALIGHARQAEHRTDDIALLLVRSVPR